MGSPVESKSTMSILRIARTTHRQGSGIQGRAPVLAAWLTCLAACSMGVSGPDDHPPEVEWVTREVRAPGVEYRTFESATARSRVSYHVYVPNEYGAEPTRRFPVLYWLHGTGGGVDGIPALASHFGDAMRGGHIPPMLVVFPNGLTHSMWTDSRDGRVPVETVVVGELVPHIDATFRTLATRESRIVEGFSMGGHGAGRFGFRYHDVFGAISMLAAGPLDLDFQGPRALANPAEREMIFREVYGGDIEYYRAESPWMLAERHAESLRLGTRLRIVVGDRDSMLPMNREFHEHLTALGIPHDFVVLPGIGHQPLPLLTALADDGWEFYRQLVR
jgi:enterochelin esterase-like enzyme